MRLRARTTWSTRARRPCSTSRARARPWCPTARARVVSGASLSRNRRVVSRKNSWSSVSSRFTAPPSRCAPRRLYAANSGRVPRRRRTTNPRTTPRSSWVRPATSSRIASSTSARTGWRSCSVHAASRRATPSPSSWRTTSATWRSPGPRSAPACTGPRSTRISPRPKSSTSSTTATRACSCRASDSPRWSRRSKPDATPRVEHRLMVDGVIDGLGVVRGRGGRVPA